MKKISGIVGLAAALAAAMFTACAPVTDSSDYRLPIASTTVKPEELNKTPLKDAALKDLLVGRWIYSSGGITKHYTFTQDGKGWVVSGRDAPAKGSSSVRAVISSDELFNYEEFDVATDNGGGIILTVNNPSAAGDAVAGKWKFDGTNLFNTATDTGFPGVTTSDYGTANTGIFATKLNNKELHANGTIVRLNFDWKNKVLYRDDSNEVYTFDRRSAPREFEAVTDGFAISYTYTVVTPSADRGGATAPTYSMGPAQTGRIVDIQKDIETLNGLIKRGYGISEFEMPVAFLPDPSGLKLMTVKVYNSKFGTVKDYENVVYTRIVGANEAFEGVKFTVNDEPYEVRRVAAGVDRWAIAWASTAGTNNARPLPTDNAPTTFGADDFDWKGQNLRANGEGKVKITGIEFEDAGPMFVFKLEDKYIGRALIKDLLDGGGSVPAYTYWNATTNASVSQTAQTYSATTAGTDIPIHAVRQLLTRSVNNETHVVIGDRSISAYTPQYSINKDWYNFIWEVTYAEHKAATVAAVAPAAPVQLTDLENVKIYGTYTPSSYAGGQTVILNGKHIAQEATLNFYGLKKDTDKKDSDSWNNGTPTDATKVYAMNSGEQVFTAKIKLEDYKDGITYAEMLQRLGVPNPADVRVTLDRLNTTPANRDFREEVYKFKHWAADTYVASTPANFQEQLTTQKGAPANKFQSLATAPTGAPAVGQIIDGATINFFAQYEQKGAIAMFYAIPATGTFNEIGGTPDEKAAYDSTTNVVKFEMTQANVGTALSPAAMYSKVVSTTPPSITFENKTYKFNGWSSAATGYTAGTPNTVTPAATVGDVLGGSYSGWNTPRIYYAIYVEDPNAKIAITATDLAVNFADVTYGDVPATTAGFESLKSKIKSIEFAQGGNTIDVTSMFNITTIAASSTSGYDGTVGGDDKVDVTVTLKDGAAKDKYELHEPAGTVAPSLKVENQAVTVNAKKLTAAMFTVKIKTGLTASGTAPAADKFEKFKESTPTDNNVEITSNVGEFVQAGGTKKTANELIKTITSADSNAGGAGAYDKDTAGTYAITITITVLEDANNYELDPTGGLVYTALPVTLVQ